MGDLYKQYYAIARLAHFRERQFIHSFSDTSPLADQGISSNRETEIDTDTQHIFEIDTSSAIPQTLIHKTDSIDGAHIPKIYGYNQIKHNTNKYSVVSSKHRRHYFQKQLLSASVDSAYPSAIGTNLLSFDVKRQHSSEGDISRDTKVKVNFHCSDKPSVANKQEDPLKMAGNEEMDMNGKFNYTENSSLMRSSDSSLSKEFQNFERDELDSIGDSVFSFSSTEEDSDKIALLTKSMEIEEKHDLEKVIEVNESEADESVFVEEGEVEMDDDSITENIEYTKHLDEPEQAEEAPPEHHHDKNEIEKRPHQNSRLKQPNYNYRHKSEKAEKQVSFDTEEVIIYGTSEKSYLSDSDVNSNAERIIVQGAGTTKSGTKSSSLGNIPYNNGKEGNEDFFPRENKASMKRKEWIMKFKKQKQTEKMRESKESDYKTPLQRKDAIIKQLKKELDETYKALSQKEQEISALCDNKDGDGWEIVKEKDNEITDMRKELTDLKASNVKLQDDTANKSQDIEELAREIEKIKKEFRERERYHNDMYLKMYEKGQKAAQIERDEEIEEMAVKNPGSVSNKELAEKLKHTQSELGRWQSLARKDSYDGAKKPATESDAMLQFMKDSMFHYLTNRDDCGVHLRAIVRMLGYTDEEKQRMIQLRKKVKKESGAQFSGLLMNP